MAHTRVRCVGRQVRGLVCFRLRRQSRTAYRFFTLSFSLSPSAPLSCRLLMAYSRRLLQWRPRACGTGPVSDRGARCRRQVYRCSRVAVVVKLSRFKGRCECAWFNVTVVAVLTTMLARPWCLHTPPLVYPFVQRHYWGVSLFGYYQLKQAGVVVVVVRSKAV